MKFIVFSETNAGNVSSSLGLPEYSYYFVLKSYLPLLRRIGDVVEVLNPQSEVDPIFHQCNQDGLPCVFLSFSPPGRTLTSLRCPTISVFAWEFEDIPYESWGKEISANWAYVLRQLPGAITHSSYSKKSVRDRMGPDYIVASIPAPVWQEDGLVQAPVDVNLKKLSLQFSGYLVNSKDISWAEIEPNVQWDRKSNQSWLQPSGGGYEAGTELRGKSVPAKSVFAVLQRAVVSVKHHFVEWHNDVLEGILPPRMLTTVSEPEGATQNPECRVESLPAALRERFYSDFHTLDLEGVIYSAVINPEDGRKNHRDLISVFAETFRDCKDACLLLKLTHSNPDRGLSRLLAEIYRSTPFQCQIVLLASYLDDRGFQSMMNATSFVVNASHGEGQCLPLMEFMSSGIPAIAPNTTAMADYINSANAFIVKSSREMTSWPQDPRQVLRTFRYQIDPESLHHAYAESYRVAKDSEKYSRMATAARKSQKIFCSLDQAEKQLREFLADLESTGVLKGVRGRVG
ncbi:MAG: glycosyltransferase family 1 protein [Ketobacter sp.]|nr:MAG: glycosyltransferase family 1 protein [Ketobacter sp.]